MTLTSRSMRRLRSEGFAVDLVERWLAVIQRRRDLFGIIDLIAVRGDLRGATFVQVTSRSGMSSRLKKIQRSPFAPVILAAGNAIHLHGWDRRDGRWRLKVIEVKPEGMQPVEITPKAKRRKVERTLFDGM